MSFPGVLRFLRTKKTIPELKSARRRKHMEVKRLSTICWRRVLQRAFSFKRSKVIRQLSDFSDIRPRRPLNTVGWLLFDPAFCC
jgi:hypothetical protein